MYRYDRAASTWAPVNVNDAGIQDTTQLIDGAILSTDGSTAVFATDSQDIGGTANADGYNVFERNLTTGVTTLASATPTGVAGNGDSRMSFAVSSDGRYVAFQSTATNLPGGTGTAPGDLHIYRKDMSTGAIVQIDDASHPAGLLGGISDDGRYVAFTAGPVGDATNPQGVIRDVQAGTTKNLPGATVNGDDYSLGGSSVSLSGDGSTAFYYGYDNTGHTQQFVCAIAAATCVPTVHVGDVALSTNGNDLVYDSGTGPLDTTDVANVFQLDRSTGITTNLTIGTDGQPLAQPATLEGLSGDGSTVVFYTCGATNLPSGGCGVYLRGPSIASSLTPVLASAAIQAPQESDRLLTRQLKLTLSAGSPSATSYQYGWLPPGTSGNVPTLGLQTCTSVTGSCLLNYASTSPAQAGWTLFVSAINASGASLWTKATNVSGSTNITTPPAPMLIAIGDSITSGHHKSSPLLQVVCNDPSYGYPFYVSAALQTELPRQWQLGGYQNFARSGFSTSAVLDGGTDACGAKYGSSTPIKDADALLVSSAHHGSWNRVVITAGIDDTSWTTVLSVIAKHDALGLNKTYGATQCATDLNAWSLTNSATAAKQQAAIVANVGTIDQDLQHADSSVQITWRGYYDIAGTGSSDGAASATPAPISCAAPMESKLVVIDNLIKTNLPSTVRFVNSDSVMKDQSKYILPFYKVDVATEALEIQHYQSGWPHPNPAGAKAMAAQVSP